MIRIVRSTTALPRTQTVIRAGDVVVPMTMPDERQQRRRHWQAYRPPVSEETA
ncbi:MAG: hypothetical protein WC277_09275 [Bacilli bacterium]|jgi:hypothetical protein